MVVCAVVVAGGRGTRARQGAHDLTPKQYALVGGVSILARTINAFLKHPAIACVQVVIHKDDSDAYESCVARDLSGAARGRLLDPVFGGKDRQASVLAGLEALVDEHPETVLIHDGARPFVDVQLIDTVLENVSNFDGAVCAVPVSDTLKRGDENNVVVETVPRARLWRAQTPQGFAFGAILEAHRNAAQKGVQGFTDDASIAEWAGLQVALVEGSASNEKLTSVEDIKAADQRLKAQQADGEEQMSDTRTGTGFDVHRFGPGDHLWICGVRIAFDKALVGHSDADVGLHALTDAILGAIGEPDIGSHFPPNDPQWKNARSDIFLKHAASLVRERGGTIVNVDVTLICEAPKIGPLREAMRAAVGAILGIEIARVSIKATTSEGLGFTGRSEGVASMASASIRLPA